MLLFGVGPGLYLDLAAFIFQVPNSDSWACASRVPASTSATARIRMVLGFILHLSYEMGLICRLLPRRVLATGGGNPAHGRYETPGGLMKVPVTLPSRKNYSSG